MLEMKIFDNPPHFFLFSNNIMPGVKQVSRRMLSKHWDKMRKELRIPDEYQFYSLKDTGITDMLNKKVSNLAVRDQARHSSHFAKAYLSLSQQTALLSQPPFLPQG